MKKTFIAGASFFALPLIASAQTYLTNITSLIGSVRTIVNALIPLAIALTVLMFFFGLFQYVRQAGKGHKLGKKVMLAGIVALLIEVSLWGVIGFFQSALSINSNNASVQVPQI